MFEHQNDGPVLVSSYLDRMLEHLKKPSSGVLAVVFGSWETIVGPELARHCRPVAVDSNSVIVETDEPVWADELKWHSKVLLERIEEMSGNSQLTELVVRVGCHGSAGKSPTTYGLLKKVNSRVWG
ncbi:MAG: DUF721 domain-containing protein [Acidimicrobiaceae bacterium]|nr:DUF721 domain-containing protein [Acidimicrobiaceae bacterium]